MIKSSAVSVSTVLVQALGRADLAIVSNRVNLKHLQGAFGENLASTYLNRGAEWFQMRQSVGRQGIDMLHLKVSSDGRITDMVVSEVKTGSSRLGQTASGGQATFGYNARRLRALATRYRGLSKAVANGEVEIAKAPSIIRPQQHLEVPLGNRTNAQFWRESSTSPWKLSAKGSQIALVERQADRIADWFDASAKGQVPYRSRIFRSHLIEGNWVTTVKDASFLDQGVPESKLPVLGRVVTPFRGGGAMSRALTSAWADELRRTQPMLTDREVMIQARMLASESSNQSLGFKPIPLGRSLALGATKAGATGGVLAGAFDFGVQLMTTAEANYQQVAVNSAIGGGAGVVGYFASSGITYSLTNTILGLNLSRQVATSMGISTSCSANLLGSTTAGGIVAAVFSYGLYFTGYADLESANRMALAGVTGSLAGAAAMAATTSLVAAYATAGTGTAISTLSGAAATSATMAAIGGGSAVVGSALAATGVGLVVVGVGAGVMWGFTAYDKRQEAKRLELTGDYLSNHYGNLAK
jgi:hypothetical protein